MKPLEDRVAVVTGGSRGIGAGIVRAFLGAGARVAFNGRNPQTGRELVDELGTPDSLWYCQGSVTETQDVRRLVDGTVARFGKLDILVNNAGGSAALGPIVEIEETAWEHDLRLNLTSVFLATQAALRHMLPAGYGTIINISSVEGKVAAPSMGAYVAAKHGVNGLTKAVAAEVGRAGITVNAICPGLILTDAVMQGGPDLAESLGMTFDEMVDKLFRSKTLTGELNTVEQVAEMALFLASAVGRGITGATLSVDAGISPY
jgi:NAD(P)-dependent dehydrogenase (short-subunit alcohol dehydrogenase family)